MVEKAGYICLCFQRNDKECWMEYCYVHAEKKYKYDDWLTWTFSMGDFWRSLYRFENGKGEDLASLGIDWLQSLLLSDRHEFRHQLCASNTHIMKHHLNQTLQQHLSLIPIKWSQLFGSFYAIAPNHAPHPHLYLSSSYLSCMFPAKSN